MAKKTSPKRRFARDDADETEWRHAYAAAHEHNSAELERFRSELATASRSARRGGRAKVKAPKLLEAPALPDFSARRSPLWSREFLGRYLFDRDAGVVHDCYVAGEGCGLDTIANGTFIHFGGELDAALPDDATACSCMTEGA